MASKAAFLPPFPAPISEEIWTRKYRFPGGVSGRGKGQVAADASPDDTFWRVARAAASVEKGGKARRETIARRFHAAMADYGFLPAGRILAGAGTGREVTLFNCFVLGAIDDDLGAIFNGVKDAALTMQAGGGIGHDFSTLRPRGALVRSVGADASGPVSFMDVWDAMCRTIMSAGQRRGAMMATLRCDHPDIEEFIAAKADPARLRNFNLSVLVSDAFMAAVKADAAWPLVFDGKVYKTVEARALFEKLMRATYDYAEPGVIFIDRINGENNLNYCETISATNPCGEQPLPPYGACLLGSINLARLVRDPFTADAGIDVEALTHRVGVAIHLLDNIIDVSRYPLDAQAKEAKAKRRIGLGVTGLADALIFCGLDYGSAAGRAKAAEWMRVIQNAAYAASAELAAEKGAFPLFDRDAFLARPNLQRLDRDVRALIETHGIRNGCLTSIAPTGTISLLAGNVSSGIEPVFGFSYRRRMLAADGSAREEVVEDYAYRMFKKETETAGGPGDAPLPETFVTAESLAPHAHLAMQAALQPYVDSAISKTINCPEDISFEAFRDVYAEAYRLGLKGCTTYRPNAVTGAVLSRGPETTDAASGADGRAAGTEAETETAAGADARAGAGDGGSTGDGDCTGDCAGVGADMLARRAAAIGRDSDEQAGGAAALTVAAARGAGDVAHASAQRGGIVYMTKPLERDDALQGYTYKIKWPASPHALYVTVNDIEREGRRRPFEIFINTKNLEHYAWTVGLTRMISAVFRRGGDVTFVAEELKAVFDPEGGQWMGGKYVPSLLAAIGDVIEKHMIRIGFMLPDADDGALPVAPDAVRVESERIGGDARRGESSGGAAHFGADDETGVRTGDGARHDRWAAEAGMRPLGKTCPKCGNRSLFRIEGCWSCNQCDYSHCG